MYKILDIVSIVPVGRNLCTIRCQFYFVVNKVPTTEAHLTNDNVEEVRYFLFMCVYTATALQKETNEVSVATSSATWRFTFMVLLITQIPDARLDFGKKKKANIRYGPRRGDELHLFQRELSGRKLIRDYNEPPRKESS